MVAINIFKLAVPIVTMALSVQSAPFKDPNWVDIGACHAIADDGQYHGWTLNYLSSLNGKTFWYNKKGFYAGWYYREGVVKLSAGRSPTGKGVMGVAWVSPAQADRTVLNYYELKPGQTCSAYVGQVPANAQQQVFVADTVQY